MGVFLLCNFCCTAFEYYFLLTYFCTWQEWCVTVLLNACPWAKWITIAGKIICPKTEPFSTRMACLWMWSTSTRTCAPVVTDWCAKTTSVLFKRTLPTRTIISTKINCIYTNHMLIIIRVIREWMREHISPFIETSHNLKMRSLFIILLNY